MYKNIEEILKDRLTEKDYKKIIKIKNPYLHQFITRFIKICNPDTVFVSDDSPQDLQYIRDEATRVNEERKLAIEGHTIHFDGFYDQARDKENTKFLLPQGIDMGPYAVSTDKNDGLKEIHNLLKNAMKGKQLFICFFCLGPTNSEFSIPCIQLTDSSYVAHSETILYRAGYKEFMRLGDTPKFFRFVHSAGELEGAVSKNVDKRRIYIDIEEDIVCSVNTQYGGNTIGHKKLAMRLAINRASEEGNWLTEHMFLMGVHGPKKRKTYFTGAFPSLCGKTSTSMIKGETIVGDDIVYLRKRGDEVKAVNVEKGIFGIIQGINSKDDPLIWNALNAKGEIIFSNVLLTENNTPYWIDKDGKMPEKGVNHSGNWFVGKKDKNGNTVPPSHKNARFTIDLKTLKNVDSELHNPKGVTVGGIIYGGRDSDTWVPVEESFDWVHGIITKGASLESETTAATLGQEGVRKFNPMANLDFLSIPLGRYVKDNLSFGRFLVKPPKIFSVNYFLKDSDGQFVNSKEDKKIWLKWMELRVHNECRALKTPTGFLPEYQDLKKLFLKYLDKHYSKEDYVKQFTLRIPENLAKIERITGIYKTKVSDTTPEMFEILEDQKKRLEAAQNAHGDYVAPDVFEVC